MMTKRPCLNATDAPHSDFPILSHVKFLPTSLIIFLKTPWQLFPSQPSYSPPALAGTADELCQSVGTVMEMTSQSVAVLGLFSAGPWRGTSSHECGRNHIFVLNKQCETGWNTKCAYCFKQSQHRMGFSFVPGSNVKFLRKKNYSLFAYKQGGSLWWFQHLSIQV